MITGPPDTPYEGGQYHGVLLFPADYPFKPPAIKMMTPNGRFKTNTRLCLSISDYHPDTWNPAWNVSTILTGLLSFMVADEHTAGSITTTNEIKKNLAKQSKAYNLRQNKLFQENFRELLEPLRKEVEEQKKQELLEAEKNKRHINTTNEANSTQPEEAGVEAKPSGNQGGLSRNQKIVGCTVLIFSWLVISKILNTTP